MDLSQRDVMKARSLIMTVRNQMIEDGYHYPNEELIALGEALIILGTEPKRVPHMGEDQEEE